jgi:hypothetical protein
MVNPGKGTGKNTFHRYPVFPGGGVNTLNLIVNVFPGPEGIQQIGHKLYIPQPQVFPDYPGPDFGLNVFVNSKTQIDS